MAAECDGAAEHVEDRMCEEHDIAHHVCLVLSTVRDPESGKVSRARGRSTLIWISPEMSQLTLVAGAAPAEPTVA